MATTFFPARSAAWAIVSAWRIPVVAKLVELLKFVSPVRWNVLFVEPCEDGHAPVARDAQPTPVFGGNAWSSPFLPFRPSSMRSSISGSKPFFAYLSTRSGRIPSAANMTTLSLKSKSGSPLCFFEPPAAAPPTTNNVSTATSADTSMSWRVIVSPLLD